MAKEFWYSIKNGWKTLIPIIVFSVISWCPKLSLPVSISILSLGITFSLALMNMASQNSRWLMNKIVEILESIIKESESYKDLLTRYLMGKVKIEELAGADILIIYKTKIQLLTNYKKLIKGGKNEIEFDNIEDDYKKIESEIKKLDKTNTDCEIKCLVNDILINLNKIIDDSSKLILKSRYIITK
ncbi:hypothetical protein [Lactobacillus panisapium]|uniref:hypothetical protein n=1 Tax=Lactobacillus panisapium TaxID=2012495 RepID=UPI0022E1AA20|nr:hypothetical protein [Lactobacillus panisapium]